MDRTTGTNHVVSGGKRQFTDGPPGTTVNDAWLNSIQEEIMYIIEGAGIAPSASDTTQLKQAIASIIGLQLILATSHNGILTRANGDGYYTCGPTGSGATIILAGLDSIPDGARFARLSIRLTTDHTADATADCYTIVSCMELIATVVGGEVAQYANLQNEKTRDYQLVDVPLDASKKFRLYWVKTTTANSTHNLDVGVLGYIF